MCFFAKKYYPIFWVNIKWKMALLSLRLVLKIVDCKRKNSLFYFLLSYMKKYLIAV